MGNYGSMPSGGKGYSPPYKGHEAMCVNKQQGMNPAIGVGARKVTEGRKPPVESAGKGKGHGGRGYQTAKLKHK
jgi:hypothetical protein